MPSSFRWIDEPKVPGFQAGATVLSSFPSAGLAATVAAHYVIRSLNLPRIGVLESPDSPPIAVVQSGDVQPPIRVYGRSDLAVVLSEFPPTMATVGPLALAIIEGAEQRKAKAVIGLEGVVPHPVEEDATEEEAAPSVWSATSSRSPPARASLLAAKARPLEDGVIGGVSGALLVAGLHREIPVSVLLVSARDAGFPDHRAGAALIETLDRLLPALKIDTGPLRTQAEMIERALRQAMKGQVAAGKPSPEGQREPAMYQ